MTLAEEINGLLGKSRRYLDSAEILRIQHDYDSAISRLYYAMFYAAEALLLGEGKAFSSHRAVISAFARLFIKAGLMPKELHQWLREAFEKRQISDYEILTGIDDSAVQDLQAKAERFLSMTEEFLRSRTR